MKRRSAEDRHHEKALRWTQCAACSYDLATGEGERACHYYACPGLPEELDVFCPTCLYDFWTREGAPACGRTPCCDFAIEEAPRRVATLREWRARHAPDDAVVGTTGVAR